MKTLNMIPEETKTFFMTREQYEEEKRINENLNAFFQSRGIRNILIESGNDDIKLFQFCETTAKGNIKKVITNYFYKIEKKC